ncbi:hypothetical protein SLW70_07190 [Flavobacterium sp. NG2]|uniref:hypothetical protein n=1 Tax=Flavobacterium sp. NG2 TaxID=3097547 RepID=UPI002A839ABB|nr:hypothetical protein [Flavobacterium sp. NG2]WPR72896.1 hypothetical protein SLW70_07190 [Flavobacterium sp. NG2]
MLFSVVSFGQEQSIIGEGNTIKKDTTVSQKAEIRICVPSRNSIQPLYVVNGVFRSNIDDLDPKEVVSFEILKDAKANSLYGDKAKNGVVLINTKKKTKK